MKQGLRPFRISAPDPPSWWSRLRRRPDPDGAAFALRLALHEHGPRELMGSRLGETLLPFHLDGPQVRKLFLDAYREATTAFLDDAALNADEIAYLTALHRAFDLSQAEVDQIEEEATHPRLGRLIRDVVGDGAVDAEERAALERLRESTRLAQPVYRRLMREAVSPAIDERIGVAVADRRFTDEEWADLKELAAHLGYDLVASEKTQEGLDYLRMLSKIEEGDIPEVPVAIKLQKGETCHFTAATDWFELRSVTRRISYAGPTVSIPIVKGVRFRMGSIAPMFHRADELKQIDRGTLYITNKRLFFDGAAKNTTIRLAKVTSFQVYSDAIVVDKETGRSPHLFIHGNIELAAVILGAALAAA